MGGVGEPAPEQVAAVERALCRAIAELRLVAFTLDGLRRVAEPHDLGVVDGAKRLFFHQVGGASRSGRPYGWRWADLRKLSDLELLDRRFPGSRPAPSGRHQRWDRIIASVSRRPELGPP